MNDQTRDALCLVPVLVLFAVAAIRREWSVLHGGEFSLPLNEKIYIGLVQLVKGNESVGQAYENASNKPDVVAYYAWMNIMGGVFTLIICIIWVMFII